jgi:hypothetical protein
MGFGRHAGMETEAAALVNASADGSSGSQAGKVCKVKTLRPWLGPTAMPKDMWIGHCSERGYSGG